MTVSAKIRRNTILNSMIKKQGFPTSPAPYKVVRKMYKEITSNDNEAQFHTAEKVLQLHNPGSPKMSTPKGKPSPDPKKDNLGIYCKYSVETLMFDEDWAIIMTISDIQNEI